MLASRYVDINSWGDQHGDLDGDGRSDLVNQWWDATSPDLDVMNTGEVWVWYGADLLAAWEDLQRQRGQPAAGARRRGRVR